MLALTTIGPHWPPCVRSVCAYVGRRRPSLTCRRCVLFLLDASALQSDMKSELRARADIGIKAKSDAMVQYRKAMQAKEEVRELSAT